MKTMWENKRLDFPHLADIITASLDKLDDYRERADDVPVYFFAICKCHSLKNISILMPNSNQSYAQTHVVSSAYTREGSRYTGDVY